MATAVGSVVRLTYGAIHFGRVDNIEYFVCDRPAHSSRTGCPAKGASVKIRST